MHAHRWHHGTVTDTQVVSAKKPKPWTAEYAQIGAAPGNHDPERAQFESDADFAFAFAAAAEIIAEHWDRTQADDTLMLPTLYLYRHSLEVGIKACVTAMLNSMEFEVPPGVEPPVNVGKIRTDLVSSHKLDVLASHLAALTPLFRFHVHERLAQVCAMFAQLDQNGQALRYATVKAGAAVQPARQNPVYINVPELVRQAGEACAILDELLGEVHDLQSAQLYWGPDYARISDREYERLVRLRAAQRRARHYLKLRRTRQALFSRRPGKDSRVEAQS
jgi:hypothetical protein